MNTTTSKIIMSIVVVFFLVFFGFKFFGFVNEQVDTEKAVKYTVNENIVFDGILVRNEEVITYNKSGIIDYVYADGSKLSQKSTIANVFDSESQIIAKNKISDIENEINNLKRSQNPGTTNYAKPETIKSQIDEKYELLTYQIEHKNLETIKQIKSEILVLMNIYNIVTNVDENFDSRIADLELQLENYKAQYGSPKDTVKTDHTGYFVSKTDGFESKISIKNIDKINEKTIKSVLNGENPDRVDNAIGKILDSYECKVVGITKQSSKILKDSNLKIRFGNSSDIHNVTVDDVKKIDDENCIVIINCDAINEKISRNRISKIELIFDEFEGLKIPRDAITFKDIVEKVKDENGNEVNQTTKYKGVYIQLGQEIVFRKIDVIFEGDEFAISKIVSNSDYLSLYDQIIVEEVDKDDK